MNRSALPYAALTLLILSAMFTACTITPVDQTGGGPDSTAVLFKDVSAANLPVDNLSGNSTKAKAVDIDGDGDLDIVVAVALQPNKILINDGTGVFTDESVNRLPFQNFDSRDVTVADFDGNGSPDLFFVSSDNQTNELYLNNGDGTFTDAGGRIPVTGTSYGVLAADIDGDGDFDLFIGNNGPNIILINNGSGFFQDQSATRLPPQSNDITRGLALADVTSDGNPDIIIANENDNRVLINEGGGFFINEAQNRLPLVGAVQETRNVNVADIDGDSDPDIYFGNVNIFQTGSDPQDRLLTNDGRGFFTDVTSSQLPVIKTNTAASVFFDIDRDGDADIIVGDFGSLDNPTGNYSGDNLARVFINNGSGVFSDETSTYFPENFSPAANDFEIADFNGDGLMDIYIANFNSPDVLLLQEMH